MHRHSRQSGFSLFELILVIVLLGIMAGVAGLLITSPIDAYRDQVRRQLLVDQAEMALRQIARDVRQALPNSIRSVAVGTGFSLEMVNTIDGARYRDEFGGVFLLDTDVLDFTAADNQFNFLGLLGSASLAAGQRIAIYNTSPDDIYPDAANDSNPGVVTTSMTSLILAPNGNEHQVTMAPPFQFSQQSPGQRAFVVDGPISYLCDPLTGQITRFTNYDYLVAQPAAVPMGASQGPLVTKLTSCSLDYSAGTATRGGLITLEISLSDSGETITLLHQIHVDNVP
jgi:MSHA biogenesis protein MshO